MTADKIKEMEKGKVGDKLLLKIAVILIVLLMAMSCVAPCIAVVENSTNNVSNADVANATMLNRQIDKTTNISFSYCQKSDYDFYAVIKWWDPPTYAGSLSYDFSYISCGDYSADPERKFAKRRVGYFHTERIPPDVQIQKVWLEVLISRTCCDGVPGSDIAVCHSNYYTIPSDIPPDAHETYLVAQAWEGIGETFAIIPAPTHEFVEWHGYEFIEWEHRTVEIDPEIIKRDAVTSIAFRLVNDLAGGAHRAVLMDSTVKLVISTENQPPFASFTYTPENPVVGEEITFDASSSYDPDGGTIVEYSWNFGDGNITEDKVVTHTYTEAGEYTVTLTVTDNYELIDALSEVVEVIQFRLHITDAQTDKEAYWLNDAVDITCRVVDEQGSDVLADIVEADIEKPDGSEVTVTLDPIRDPFSPPPLTSDNLAYYTGHFIPAPGVGTYEDAVGTYWISIFAEKEGSGCDVTSFSFDVLATKLLVQVWKVQITIGEPPKISPDSGAEVTVKTGEGDLTIASGPTNAQGLFIRDSILPGTYLVEVEGSQSYRRQIEIPPGPSKVVEFPFNREEFMKQQSKNKALEAYSRLKLRWIDITWTYEVQKRLMSIFTTAYSAIDAAREVAMELFAERVIVGLSGDTMSDALVGKFQYSALRVIEEFKKKVDDPPDMNYDQVFPLELPDPITLPPDYDGIYTDSLVQLVNALANQCAIEEALLTSFERYQGALEANEPEYMTMQLEAIIDYSNLLMANGAEVEQAAALVKAEIDSFGCEAGVTVQDFQTRLASEGFTPEEEQELRNMNFTDDDLETYKQFLLSFSFLDIVEGLEDIEAVARNRVEFASNFSCQADEVLSLLTQNESELSYSPVSHDFGDKYEGEKDSTTFEIWNSGTGTLIYSQNYSCDWVHIHPTSGSSAGEHDNITVDINTTGLSEGSHTCNISISSTEGSGTFTVTVNVMPSPNCTCGDICVNETGWWRDGDAFNPGDRPIQDAVDNATAGETICVKDGTYTENVDVNTPLTIQSENGADSTIVNALDPNDHVFEVTADYVNISGFTVTGAAAYGNAGIYVNSADYCTISDNTASNNAEGIFINPSSNCTLTNNIASNNDWHGIGLFSSSDCTLTNNIALNNGGRGIGLFNSSDCTLTNNIASNNGAGVILRLSSNCMLDSNTAINNNKSGIGLFDSHGNTIDSNTVTSNGEGIRLSSASNNIITNNDVSDNSNGICILKSSDNNTVLNNIANFNTWSGIWIFGSLYNNITENTANLNNGSGITLEAISTHNILSKNTANANNHNGILVRANSGYESETHPWGPSDNNIISGNTADTNDNNGICILESSSNNIILGNTVTSNGDGVLLSSASNNLIANNDVSNNDNGICLLKSSDNNTVLNNIANSNTWRGIWIFGSLYNNITENTANLNNRCGIILEAISKHNIISKNTANSNNHIGVVVKANSHYESETHPWGPSDNNIISGNTADTNNHSGIFLCQGSSNNTLSSNTASDNNRHGIYLDSSDNNTINSNTANNNGEGGIFLCNSASNTLADNNLYLNFRGIWLEEFDNGTIIINNIAHNNSNYGIIVRYSANCVLTGNNASGNGDDGIVVCSSNMNTLTSNIANDNAARGINVPYSNNNIIRDNTCKSNKNYQGIVLHYSNDNTVQSNTASKNVGGIWLWKSHSNAIINNVVLNNGPRDNGIDIVHSNDNVIINNTVSSNEWLGFNLLNSSNCTLTSNTAYDNYIGIGIWGSSDNMLGSNRASNNTLDDFRSADSHGNVVTDLTIASYPTTISFTYDNVSLKGVDTAPSDPAGKVNINKYVNVTGLTADSWIALNVSYRDGDLGGVDEDSLRMWRYDDGTWTEVPPPNGVNTAENYVYANISLFSIFAPLENASGIASPEITSFAPPSPVNDTICTWRTFNVTVNQTVNVSWYLNGSIQQTNESAQEASCTLHANVAGEHNVTAIASNANGTAMQTWIWNVTEESSHTFECSAGWNMISFPVEPLDNDADTIFGPEYYYLCTWDTDTGGYVPVDVVETEIGYWLLVLEDRNVTVWGTQISEYNTDITQGWNMIGSLWTATNVPDGTETVPADQMYPYIYGWCGDHYVLTQDIEPGLGYWALAYVDCELHVFPAPPAAPLPVQQITWGDNDWRVRLALTSGAGTDVAEFGLHDSATDVFSAELDVPEPPSPPPSSATYQQVYFYNPENPLVKKLSTSYIPHHYVDDDEECNSWLFRLDYSGDASYVTVKWNAEDINAVPAEYSLLFIVDGEQIDMRTTPSYTFRAKTRTYEFEIRALTGGKKPDLVIEDSYEKGKAGSYIVLFVVKNIGTATAPEGHYATLYVDGVEKDKKLVSTGLEPGESYKGSFKTKVELTGKVENIKVCADSYNDVDELDEANNCLKSRWQPVAEKPPADKPTTDKPPTDKPPTDKPPKEKEAGLSD